MKKVVLERCPRGHGFWLDPGELTSLGSKTSKAAKLARRVVRYEWLPADAWKCPGCAASSLKLAALDGVVFRRCQRCTGHFLKFSEIRTIAGRTSKLYQLDGAQTPWEPWVTRVVELFREGILFSNTME
jgi:Zn-finger nucleic acid-binding protein